ncbi:MAG: RHS repeat-associated core domain-containing protein [Chlorobia bacterium]|nr:RHS repeat-associated core domain-containing protein [Fimbriimonadaceae bacterium]
MGVTNYYSVEGEVVGDYDGVDHRDYLRDAVGSVTRITGGTTNRYKPFGEDRVVDLHLPRPRFGWIGVYGYEATYLRYSHHYVRTRHYDPNIARWTTVDPLWPQESAYTYVRGNPTNWTDPSGMHITPLECKPCGKALLITPGKGGVSAVVAGDPKKGTKVTPLVSGAKCTEMAKRLFPGRNCVCVNGGFFSGSDPMGRLDPCNSPEVSGGGSPANKDRKEIIVQADYGLVTGVTGIPPSPGATNNPGRTGACLGKNNKVTALIVAEGCAAASFEKCAKAACPPGARFVWLDGGGSSQVWQNGKPLLEGNSSKDGRPDGRSVDNWIIICD